MIHLELNNAFRRAKHAHVRGMHDGVARNDKAYNRQVLVLIRGQSY